MWIPGESIIAAHSDPAACPKDSKRALSAALQKREYLRRRVRQCPGLGRGFLLERARLLVTPLGLDEAVTTLLGQGLCASSPGEITSLLK